MLDRRALFSLVLGCISPAVLAAQELAGTWFTNRGVLEVKADGEGWSATYGNGSTLTAEKKGDDIVFTAKEGRAKVTGSWQFQKGAFRFDGDWQSTSGNGNGKGEWFGWRHDPATFDEDGKLALGGAENARGKYALQLQRLEGHARGVVPEAGKLVRGLGENRMVYYMHAPKTYQPGQELPLLVFLHGSNYVSKPYVESIANTDVGERFLVVGIDGESWEDWSTPDDPRQS